MEITRYSKEQTIVARNLYGPNGVQVSRTIEQIPSIVTALLQLNLNLSTIRPDELALLNCMTRVQEGYRTQYLNRAVEDAMNMFDYHMECNPYTEEQYQHLQDLVEALIQETVVADMM